MSGPAGGPSTGRRSPDQRSTDPRSADRQSHDRRSSDRRPDGGRNGEPAPGPAPHRASRGTLSTRFFAGQAAVVAAMTASMIAVSLLVGPGVFHEHMMMAGTDDPRTAAQHAEQAFLSSAWITLAAGLALGVLAALAVSLFSAGRLRRSLDDLTTAARRIARGRYDIRLTDPRAGRELAALVASVNELAETISATEATRRRMLTDLAHELRTPLASLDAVLEGLEDGVLVADEPTLAALRTQSSRIGRLVSDVRDVSAAEEGRLTLRRASLSPVEILGQARAAALPGFERAGVRLVARASDELPFVDADPDRIAQVLANLLSNALRHTPAGGRVEISARLDAAGVRFAVADDGAGIEPDALAHVFERFYRADTARDRGHGGSGVGLTISRAIVRAHGGELTASSAGPGTGATFTLTLPATS